MFELVTVPKLLITEFIIKLFIRLSAIFTGIIANIQTNIYNPIVGFLLSKKLIQKLNINK